MALIAAVLVLCLGLVLSGNAAYLLCLVNAARASRKDSERESVASLRQWQPDGSGSDATRITVVIPAHDEELVLAHTLASLHASRYPRNRFRVLVIADNCADTTAQIGRDCGANVLVRHDTTARGKGFALSWAFDQLLDARSEHFDDVSEVFAIVDADTAVDSLFLESVHRAFQSLGESERANFAIQGRYGVSNTTDGWRPRLMQCAFDLVNHVRLLGAERMKWYVGLKGNGMAFSRSLLVRAVWSGRSITEDMDYSLDLLVTHGIRVRYLSAALVRAQMPRESCASVSQRQRWERGRADLVRRWHGPLWANACRRRDAVGWSAWLEAMSLPLSEIVGLWLAWVVIALVAIALGKPSAGLSWAVGLWVGVAGLAISAYVLVGLRLAGASRDIYLSLLRAPFFVAWKLWVRLRGAIFGAGKKRGGPDHDEWVRTDRIRPDDSEGWNHLDSRDDQEQTSKKG